MDDSVEIINILQETEGYGRVQKVKPRSQWRKEDKENDFGIQCKLFSCIFSLVENRFFGIQFDRECWQESILVLQHTSQMIENCFKFCQKNNNKFF